MLVVFGANGRSGVEVVRQAMARGLPVRAVCRDNRDQHRLLEFLEPRQIFHADPDRPQTLEVAKEGATTIVSCLDRRTSGLDSDDFLHTAAEHALRGAPKGVHLSVMGASRLSFDRLLRQAALMDYGATKVGAAIFRVSCYHDEIAGCEGTLKGRYAPVSRAEAARLLLDWLPRAHPKEEVAIGGPQVFSGTELKPLLQRFRSLTPVPPFPGLPATDLSVTPSQTLAVTGTVPSERLEVWLCTPPPPPTPRIDPDRHPGDQGQDIPTLYVTPPVRHDLHAQLLADAGRLDCSGKSLDFSQAIPTGPREPTRVGELTALEEVQLLDADGNLRHRGAIHYFYDDPSRSVFFWWAGQGVPRRVWEQLDVVARKRLRQDARFAEDPGLAALRV